MCMLMRLSLPELAHESSMTMLMELSCARAREACTHTTTLGNSADRGADRGTYRMSAPTKNKGKCAPEVMWKWACK